MRYSAQESGEAVFDELSAAARLSIFQLMERTGLSRPQVNYGVRWLRDTLGHEALVTNVDHTYELALNKETVADYRRRRVNFLVRSLDRLNRVIKAGAIKFRSDTDGKLAAELIGTAASLLRRSGDMPSEDKPRMAENVR